MTNILGRLNVTAVLLLTCSIAPCAYGSVASAGTAVAVDVTGAGNVSGIVQDGTKPKNGGLDTFGYAISANLLGASKTWSGVTFVPGAAGAVDAASSTIIALPQGSFTALKLLAVGTNGNQLNQKFLITYTDGTTAATTQSVSDWWGPQSYSGESTVLSMASCVKPDGGKCSGPTAVYGYTITMNGSKTAKSLTLPHNRNVILLAAALLPAAVPVTAAVNLSGAANVHALFDDGTVPTHGGLVGSGYAISANLTGATVSWSGATFSMGAAGAANALSSATVALPTGNFTALKLLGVGAHENQTNQPFIVTYTDGTTTTFHQSVSNWWSNSHNPGESTALSMAYCVTPSGGKCPVATALYGFTLTLNGAKSVKSLTLPNNRNVVLLGAALVGAQSVTTAPTMLAFGAATYNVAQSAKAALVSVSRSGGPANAAVSVQYETADGTGTAGSVYTDTSGTLSWAANDTAAKTVSVPILNSTPFTGEKSFTIALFNPTADAELNTPSLATVNVTGTGTAAASSVQLTAATYTVAANAGSLTVSVTRSSGATSAASVSYATANGTAVAGTNYSSSSGTLHWAANDSANKSFTVPITNAPSMTASANFKLQISAPNGATLGPNSAATVTITPVSTPPGGGGTASYGRLISRGVKSYASSGTASSANDANYNTTWRSSSVPATLAYDLSSVDAANRKKILLAWYNDSTYGYDHSLHGVVGYNNVGSYTIEANAGAGGGVPPTSGWVVLASVSKSTLHSREHVVNFAGYNWIRMNATASDGSSGNDDISVNMDVYDASPPRDGWFFVGDSITANCMGHGNLGSVTSDSFGNQVNALVGVNPPQENAGIPGWTSVNWMAYLPMWLPNFPGRYVTLNVGTNDAAGSEKPSVFYGNMAALVGDVLASGNIPVIPTIPWSRDATHAASIPGLNAQIQNLYKDFPSVIPGPDLYTLFKNNQDLISSDNVHPTSSGCAALRAQWASVAAKAAY